MLLSEDDIKRIEKLGYNRNFFVKNKKGCFKLKNINGICVFNNGKICSIYENRPEGCSLYPLIFDNQNRSAIIDEECPFSDRFRFSGSDIKRLHNLIIKIKLERKNRKIKAKDKFLK